MEQLIKAVKKQLIENRRLFQEAISLDEEKWGKATSWESLLEVFENMTISEQKEQVNQNVIIYYQADPCMTLQIALKTFATSYQVILVIPQESIAVNTLLVELIQKEARKLGLKNILKLYTNENLMKVIQKEEMIGKIICIGDRFEMHKVKHHTNIPVKYISYQYMPVYVENMTKSFPMIQQIEEVAFEKEWEVEFLQDKKEFLEKIEKEQCQYITILGADQDLIEKVKALPFIQNVYQNENGVGKQKFEFKF